jgi:hypothetical protein
MRSRSDYEEYLVRLYFGDSDLLTACINRAYRDFNRTIHGLKQVTMKNVIHQEASAYLRKSFGEIQTGVVRIEDFKIFDSWHHSICNGLSNCYKSHGYQNFSIGQGQKWINMVFKYIFTVGDNRLPGFSKFYQFCHIPIDNIILNQLKEKYFFSGLSCAWSRLNDYKEYLDFQKWIRDRFSGDPLDVEFELWMQGSKTEDIREGEGIFFEKRKSLQVQSNRDEPIIGPYDQSRIVLCSADAGPGSQSNVPKPAAYFFPGAKWVGAIRNAASALNCRFVILTTAHGLVNKDDTIFPYDLKAEENKEEVSRIWRETLPAILGRNQYDIMIFYGGGVPKKIYSELLLPLLRTLKIDFLTFGRPNMFDVGKVVEIVC